MSQSGDEQAECPLCMEPLEADDLNFYPCTCGYQICRFCWNRIREGENGLCPACRKAYPENPADFTPLSQEQVAAMKTEKRAREQQRRNKSQESRRQLSSVRVVQKNLVFVVGLPIRLADPEILKKQEYFGKYGKIHKVVINHSTSYAGSQGPSASAYVTYVSCADALRAIQNVNNANIDGRILKGSLGTTKYCANFMRNQPCPKPDCMYLHELGDPKASFTKEEMHQGLHQAYERQLHNQLLSQTAPIKDPPASQTSAPQTGFISSTVVTSSSINIANSKSKNSGSGSISLSSSSSSTSSTSSISGNKEAWPSLGSSPPPQDISQQPSNTRSTEVNIQNTGKTKGKQNKENGQSNGENGVGNGKTKQGKESKKQKANKAATAAADKQNTNTGNTNSNSNNNTNNNSNEESVQIFTDSTNVEHSEQLTNNDKTQKQDFREQTFGMPMGVSLPNNDENNIDLDSDRHSLLDSHDLLDNSDHSLLEDNDNHDLLNDSLLGKNNLINSHRMLDAFILPTPETSRLLQHGDMNADYNMVNNRDVNFLNMASLNNPLVEAQKSILLNNDILRSKELLSSLNTISDPYIPFVNPLDINTNNFQHPSNIQQTYNARMGQNYPMYSSQNMTNPMLTPTLTNGLINENGILSDGKYGENNMNKFFNDFHKNQQLKTISNQGNLEIPNSPLANIIQPSEMQSLAFVESQHLQKKYGLGGETHLNYNGRPQTEKLGSSYITQNCNLEQNGDERSQSKPSTVDDDLDFDPFKETQKAFAEILETENKQTDTRCSPEINECMTRRSRHPPPGFTHMNAFGIGVPRPQQATGFTQGNGMTDWTQLDPAIMSTNFTQSKNMLQSPQDLYSRFNQFPINQPVNGINQQLSKLMQNQQSGANMSRLNQLVLNQQANRLSEQNNFNQQQNVMNNLNSDALYLQQQQQQQQQQRKLQSLMGQNPNGWTMPTMMNPHLLMQNGQYPNNRNGYYNPTPSNGTSDSKYNNIPLPPGFANVQSAKNTSECIESK